MLIQISGSLFHPSCDDALNAIESALENPQNSHIRIDQIAPSYDRTPEVFFDLKTRAILYEIRLKLERIQALFHKIENSDTLWIFCGQHDCIGSVFALALRCDLRLWTNSQCRIGLIENFFDTPKPVWEKPRALSKECYKTICSLGEDEGSLSVKKGFELNIIHSLNADLDSSWRPFLNFSKQSIRRTKSFMSKFVNPKEKKFELPSLKFEHDFFSESTLALSLASHPLPLCIEITNQSWNKNVLHFILRCFPFSFFLVDAESSQPVFNEILNDFPRTNHRTPLKVVLKNHSLREDYTKLAIVKQTPTLVYFQIQNKEFEFGFVLCKNTECLEIQTENTQNAHYPEPFDYALGKLGRGSHSNQGDFLASLEVTKTPFIFSKAKFSVLGEARQLFRDELIFLAEKNNLPVHQVISSLEKEGWDLSSLEEIPRSSRIKNSQVVNAYKISQQCLIFSSAIFWCFEQQVFATSPLQSSLWFEKILGVPKDEAGFALRMITDFHPHFIRAFLAQSFQNGDRFLAGYEKGFQRVCQNRRSSWL